MMDLAVAKLAGYTRRVYADLEKQSSNQKQASRSSMDESMEKNE